MIFDRANYIHDPSPLENELKILFNFGNNLTLLEIGACEGEDSIRYSKLFPNATIYAVEPLPKNIDLITKNIEKYNIKNVKIFAVALSEKNGTAEFYVSEGTPKDVEIIDWDFGNKSSSLLQPDEHINKVKWIKFTEKIRVNTITLDSFCEQNKIYVIDFIHMDVQGAELMVLKGADCMISHIKVIWLEVAKITLYKNQPLVNDIESFMERHNFILIKNCVDDISGDQLYISKKYFSNYKKLFPGIKGKPSIFHRFIRFIWHQLILI